MGRKVRLRGEHLTHKTLWRTAKRFLDAGVAQPKGQFYPLLASIVFSYFAFEAYLNSVLRDVAPDVWKNERKFFSGGKYKGTLGKFEYLAELGKFPVDKSRRPFQTVRKLAEARDFLAHAKVEEYDLIVPVEKLDEPKPHSSILDFYSSSQFASKAVADVEALLDGLQVALVGRFGDLRIGSAVGAFSGIDSSWHGSLVEEEEKPRMPNKALQPASRAKHPGKARKLTRAALG